MTLSIRPVTETDKPAIRTLLSLHNLPLDGLFVGDSEYFVAYDGSMFAGCAGLEFYPPDALLRSVAIVPDYQRIGIATRLVDFMIAQAKEHNVEKIVLLTTSAAGFFQKRGFRIINRSDLGNRNMQTSAEFLHACPSSAVCEVFDTGLKSCRKISERNTDQPIQNIIQQRFSCRSYLNEPINHDHRQAVKNVLAAQKIGPLGTHARFELVAATQDDSKALKGLGTYGFIKNPAAFIIGAVEQGAKNLEDYGYLLEHIILSVTDIGLGTCWLGGSFTKSSFAKKICLRDTEIIPAVVSTGYIAGKSGTRGQIRDYLNASRRLPMEQLFFNDTFGNPLNKEKSNTYIQPLEMVRLAPSASNKQPWRIIHIGNAWHFYLQRTKGYGKGTMLFKFLRLADLQRVDIGIAMCHFELTARSLGLNGRWIVKEPELKTSEGTEYTATWINE